MSAPLAPSPQPQLDLAFARALLEGMDSAPVPAAPHAPDLRLTLRLQVDTERGVAVAFDEQHTAVQATRQVLALLGRPEDQGDFRTAGHGYRWQGRGWRLELVITGNPRPGGDPAAALRLRRLSIALDLRSARASRARGTLSWEEQIILRRDNSAWPNPERASALRRELKRTEANIARAERLRDADPANTDFYVQAQRKAAGELAGLLSQARH